MKTLYILAIGALLAGCSSTYMDDDLRSVPVTNNPTLFPSTAQTAQGSPF